LKGDVGLITVNYRDPRPIYEQIKSSLQQMIVTGGIAENAKLPSVRDLASQLAINPNTIQRAYKELEDEGYIVSVPGKGSYAGDSAPIRSRYINQLFTEFDSLAARLLSLGRGEDELTSHILSVSKGVTKTND
jgi:GntR family transcriptional regulator